MCIAIPQKIKKIEKNKATIETKHGEKEIDISLVSDAKVGDWILAHDKIAINKVEPQEVKKLLDLTAKGGNQKCKHSG